MRRRLQQILSSRLPAVLWTLFILILLSLPGKMLPDENGLTIPYLDKYVHFILFGSFVFLWSLYLTSRSQKKTQGMSLYWRVFIIGCAYGIAMEYVQKYLIPNRDFDLYDIVADCIGAFAGFLFTILLANPIFKNNA